MLVLELLLLGLAVLELLLDVLPFGLLFVLLLDELLDDLLLELLLEELLELLLFSTVAFFLVTVLTLVEPSALVTVSLIISSSCEGA